MLLLAQSVPSGENKGLIIQAFPVPIAVPPVKDFMIKKYFYQFADMFIVHGKGFRRFIVAFSQYLMCQLLERYFIRVGVKYKTAVVFQLVAFVVDQFLDGVAYVGIQVLEVRVVIFHFPEFTGSEDGLHGRDGRLSEPVILWGKFHMIHKLFLSFSVLILVYASETGCDKFASVLSCPAVLTVL